MFVHVWYHKGQWRISMHRPGKGMRKLGYTWQPMITSDHCNQDMTNMRNNNRKWEILRYHQGGLNKLKLELSAKDEGWRFVSQQVQQTRVCWYLQRKSCSSGNVPKAKDEGQGEWTGLNKRLPPTSQRGPSRGKQGRRSIGSWWLRDGSNPGHKGHKNKYHIIIRVIKWKECEGGQPELGQEEKAGVG